MIAAHSFASSEGAAPLLASSMGLAFEAKLKKGGPSGQGVAHVQDCDASQQVTWRQGTARGSKGRARDSLGWRVTALGGAWQ